MIRSFTSIVLQRIVAAGLTSVLVLLPGRTPDPETVTLPQGPHRETVVDDLKPHPREAKFYNERWDYNIALDSGARMSIGYSRTNLGGRHHPVCGIDLALLDFQGRDYVATKQYRREQFLYYEEEQKVECNPRYWFKGALPREHALHFNGADHGHRFLIDVTFRDIQPGMSLGNGIYKFGEEEVGIFIHIPYARVTATISVDSVVTVEEGTAYMDHTFMTERPPRLLEASYRYQAQRDSKNWSVGYVLDPSTRYAANLIGFGMEASEGKVTFRRAVANRVMETRQSNAGIEVPLRMDVLFSKGDPVQLERTSTPHELSVLYDLKGISKAIVRRFLGGEVVRFRGVGTLGNQKMLYHYDLVR